MRKIILLTLIAVVPFFTMAQKKSRKGSKTTSTTSEVTASMYEFMIIKGAEVPLMEGGEDRIVEGSKNSDDISLERKMKRLLKPPVRLLVSFDVGHVRSTEIQALNSKANEFRTMASAVKAASLYGWDFINANVVSTNDGMIHYYYMKRKK